MGAALSVVSLAALDSAPLSPPYPESESDGEDVGKELAPLSAPPSGKLPEEEVEEAYAAESVDVEETSVASPPPQPVEHGRGLVSE